MRWKVTDIAIDRPLNMDPMIPLTMDWPKREVAISANASIGPFPIRWYEQGDLVCRRYPKK